MQLLLKGPGKDVLQHQILPLLPLQALGRLASTCRQLRVLVNRLPQSTWHACAEHTLRRRAAAALLP